MGPKDFTIREARLPEDKPLILEFIMGLQRFEHAIDANRRIDASVAEEYWAVLAERVARQNGRIFIAEDGAQTPLGWAVTYESEDELFVVSEQRKIGDIVELFVVEAARGRGIGKALIAACEVWGRERRLKVMTIGALNGNFGAFAMYERTGYRPYVTILKKPLA